MGGQYPYIGNGMDRDATARQILERLGLTFTRVSSTEGLRIFGLSLLVFAIGIGSFLIGSIFMANITGIPESADFTPYDFLRDNLAGLFLSLVAVCLVSSFGEEVIYRPFLIDRISELSNPIKYSGVIAVILSSIFFGLAHSNGDL
jgi:membrane protease YdiL (CAAX protease family)